MAPEVAYNILLKCERAEKHIDDLKRAVDTFLGEEPYAIRFEENPDTGDRTYYIGKDAEVPPDIPVICGDAVHNLRTALDHLIYRLAHVHTSGKGPFDNLHFPIGETKTAFEKSLARALHYKSKLKGPTPRLGQDTVKAIRSLEPYGGGTGEYFWHLHKLDIIDKHHLLLTAASSNQYHSMVPSERALSKRDFLGAEMSESSAALDAKTFLESHTPKFPLKTGDKLWTVAKANVDENMHLPIEIAFADPPVLAGEPIIETLDEISSAVRNTVLWFEKLGMLG
jgi:hypothetical protein